MKQLLRFFAFIVFISVPCLANAQTVTASFTATPTAGCPPFFLELTDGSTTSIAGDTVLHKFLIYDGGTLVQTFTSNGYISPLTAPGRYTIVDSAYNKETGTVNVDSQVNNVIVTSNSGITTALSASATGNTVDTNICLGTHLTFHNRSDTVTGCTPAFNWTIIGGASPVTYVTESTTGTAATVNFTFTTVGTYSVSIQENTCSSYASCASSPSTTATYVVNVQGIPIACFTNNDSVACHTPAVVQYSNCSTGATTYLWKFGDGTSSTSAAATLTHTFTATGIIKDTLIAYSSFGCADTLHETGNVIVGNFNAGFTVSSPTVCVSNAVSAGTVIVTDTTTSANHFLWHDNYPSYPGYSDTASSNPATFSYTTPGTYTIKDSAYSSITGCSSVATHTVTVLAEPSVSFTGTNLYSCAPSDGVTFTPVVSPTTIASYTWAFGDGTTLSGPPPALGAETHTYTAAAGGSTYTPSLTVTNSNGCSNIAINSSYVEVGTAPSMTISSGNSSGCAGTFVYTFTTTIAPSVSYGITSVNYGDGTTVIYPVGSGSVTGSHAYGSATGGTYTVHVTYALSATAGGCSYTDSAIVHVGTTPPAFSAPGYPTLSADSVCPNAVFTATCNCTNCTSFKWYFSATATAPFAGTSVNSCLATSSYTDTGKHYITAIANEGGCTDTLHDSIRVLPPVVTFTSTAPVCSGNTIAESFTATGSATTYTWYFGDSPTATSTGSAASHTYTIGTGATDTVTLIGASTTGSYVCRDTVKSHIQLYTFQDSIRLTKSEICVGIKDSLIGNPLTYSVVPASSYSYVFEWGDGSTTMANSTPTSLSHDGSHSYSLTGVYAPTVIITNAAGCKDTVFVRKDTVTGISGNLTANGVMPYDTTCPGGLILQENNTTYNPPLSSVFSITSRHWDVNAYSVTGTGAPTPGLMPGSATVPTLSVTYPDGSFTAFVIDSNNIGCTATDSVHIFVEQPYAYFTSPDSNTLACINVPIAFHDTNTHCTYTWSFGDGTTGTGQNPTHIYSTTAGSPFTVSVTITTTAGGNLPVGCSNTYMRAGYIVMGNINPGFTLPVTSAQCPPASLVAFNTTTPINDYDYQWRVTSSSGTSALVTSPINTLLSYYLASAGTYSVELIATNPINGCTDSSADQTYIISGPAGYLQIASSAGCEPLADTVSYVSTNGVAVTNYIWEAGDGTVVTGDTLRHIYTTPGTYYPILHVSSSGCPSTQFPDSTLLASDTITVYPVPVVTVTGNPRLCFDSSETLTASGAGAGGTYDWSPATGLSAVTGSSVIASPNVTTTYTVTGTTAHGCSDTTTFTVRVDNPIGVSVSAKSIVCNSAYDTLVATGSGGDGGGGYTWTITGTGSSLVVSATGDTAYVESSGAVIHAKVIFSDTFVCSADSVLTINVDPPIDSITGVFVECQYDSTQLSDLSGGGTWVSSNPGVASISSTGMVTGISAGTVTISYERAGCFVAHAFTVNASPGMITGPNTVCQRSQITLDDTPPAGAAWSSDNNSVATVSNIGDVTGVSPGTATISYTLLSDGCAATTVITVEPLPDSTYTPANPYVCYGGNTVITINNASGIPASYLWYPNVLLNSDTIAGPTVSDTADLVYKVTITSIYGCVDSVKIPVTVYKPGTTSVSNDTSICLGASAELYAESSSETVTGDLTSFSWTPAGSLINPDKANPVATPDTTTLYSVKIVENPCFSATDTVRVTVIPQPAISITGTSPIIAGDSTLLTAVITNSVVVSQWSWAPANTIACASCYSTMVSPTANTTYTVTATTPIGCPGTSDFTVDIYCVEAKQVFVPNTFTPNGDGHNDRFYLSGIGLGMITRMSVYNRWGEQVFQTENINPNDPGAGWDGTYRGQVLPPDVFVYVFELTCETGVPFSIKGDVSIVR